MGWFASARLPSCDGALRASAVACSTSGGRGSADPPASFVPGVCEWWRFEAAAARVRGKLVEGLLISAEVLLQIWGGRCSGPGPGRRLFIVYSVSSSELAIVAARQRPWSRSSSAPRVRVPAGRCLVVVGGGGCACWSSSSWKKVRCCGCVLRFLFGFSFACNWPCNSGSFV